MSQNQQTSSNAGRILSISGLTIFVLVSMLWEIVSAYLKGGSDAPTLGILIAAIAVLGSGILFAAALIIHHAKKLSSKEDQEPSDE